MEQMNKELATREKLQGFFLAFCIVGVLSCLLLLACGVVSYVNVEFNVITLGKLSIAGIKLAYQILFKKVLVSLGTFLTVFTLSVVCVCAIVVLCIMAFRLFLLVYHNIKTLITPFGYMEIRGSYKQNLEAFNSSLFLFLLILSGFFMFDDTKIGFVSLLLIFLIVLCNWVVNVIEIYCRKGKLLDAIFIASSRIVLVCIIPIYVEKASSIDVATFFSIFHTWDFWEYLLETGWTFGWRLYLLFRLVFLPVMQILLLIPFISLYRENINNDYFQYGEKEEQKNKRIRKLIIFWCIYFGVSMIALFAFGQVLGFVHFLKYLGMFLCPAVLICAEYFAVKNAKVSCSDVYLLR